MKDQQLKELLEKVEKLLNGIDSNTMPILDIELELTSFIKESNEINKEIRGTLVSIWKELDFNNRMTAKRIVEQGGTLPE